MEHLVGRVHELAGGLGAEEGDQLVGVAAVCVLAAEQVGEAVRSLARGVWVRVRPRVEGAAAELDGGVEEAPGRGGQRMVMHRRAARAVAHQSDAAWVAAELGDVLLDPPEGGQLVLEPSVTRHLRRAARR